VEVIENRRGIEELRNGNSYEQSAGNRYVGMVKI